MEVSGEMHFTKKKREILEKTLRNNKNEPHATEKEKQKKNKMKNTFLKFFRKLLKNFWVDRSIILKFRMWIRSNYPELTLKNQIQLTGSGIGSKKTWSRCGSGWSCTEQGSGRRRRCSRCRGF